MIDILFCGNSGVFDGALTCILSILKRTQSKQPFTFHLFTMDLSDLDPKYTPIPREQVDFLNEVIQRYHPDSRAVLYDVTEYYQKYFAGCPNEGAYCSPYTLIRLFADMYPEIPDKLLYLDADILFQHDFHLADVLRRHDTGLAVLETHREARIGVLDGTKVLVRPPVLREGLGFVGQKIGEVRLVVGIDSGHQLDIWAAVVRELAVPGVAERVVAPRPLLLARGDVAVGDMHEPAVRGMVVAAEEVVVRGAHHVGRRHGNVLVPAEVVRAMAATVVYAVIDAA